MKQNAPGGAPTREELDLVVATLQRHEGAIQSIQALGFALIATHHDHGALLDKYLTGMDAIADALSPASAEISREQFHLYRQLMLDGINASAKGG